METAKQRTKLTDTSLMPYGEYKDTPMANVPASYLIWLHEHHKASPAVKEYIRDNYDVLLQERRAGK